MILFCTTNHSQRYSIFERRGRYDEWQKYRLQSFEADGSVFGLQGQGSLEQEGIKTRLTFSSRDGESTANRLYRP